MWQLCALEWQAAGSGQQASAVVGKDSDKIYIRITNDDIAIAGFGLTYYLGDDAIGSIGMKEASGRNVSDGVVEFVIMKEDFPENADLDKFGLQFMVIEETWSLSGHTEIRRIHDESVSCSRDDFYPFRGNYGGQTTNDLAGCRKVENSVRKRTVWAVYTDYQSSGRCVLYGWNTVIIRNYKINMGERNGNGK